jgi:hypothetical protein
MRKIWWTQRPNRRISVENPWEKNILFPLGKHPWFSSIWVQCGLKRWKNTEHIEGAVGSRSTITHLGTCFPAPVSEKNLTCECFDQQRMFALNHISWWCL